MSRRGATWLAWGVWAVSVALWLASFVLRSIGNVSGGFERALSTLAFVALSTAGAVVASRRPELPFGWLVSGYGLLVGLEGLAIGYALLAGNPAVAGQLGDGTAAAVVGVWIAPVANALLTLALLFVPNGRL